MAKWRRRLPVGAEVVPGEGTHFRVWAPQRRQVEVVVEGEQGKAAKGRGALDAEPGGYFGGLIREVGPGALYRYRLDGEDDLYPDPASRFQPTGPHGPSAVVDPGAYAWRDAGWPGVHLSGQVIYELHVGTFTPEGTWAAATAQLDELAKAGVTLLEVMPVAEFPGRFGWGYDGVDLYAPSHLYGLPDDFRHFVDRAHAAGLGVILDVVYNHFGPDGNYATAFADAYFTDRYENEWGDAINFDGPDAAPVREFFIANAGYWVDEYHLDGLRLDATQSIIDQSPTHVLAEIGRRVREAAHGRGTIVVNENEPQHTRLVRPVAEGGYGLDALWNDDFHHSAHVALTGHNEAYYSDYLGSPQEFVSAAKYGFLYQGQLYAWQGKGRGTPTAGLPHGAFVTFLENHDQVANSAFGRRVHQLTSPGRYRAMTALLLLGPGTPMLFQGQEFAASSPFLYFADHKPELASKVRKGRVEFLRQFASLAQPETRRQVARPDDPQTFRRCKLDFDERQSHREAYDLHRDLLRLRREDPVVRLQGQEGLDGAVLGAHAFVLRFFARDGHDRLLVVNLGRDLTLTHLPEPLLAPPEGTAWAIGWSSEDPRYGGAGTPPIEHENSWRIPGEAAVLLVPRPS